MPVLKSKIIIEGACGVGKTTLIKNLGATRDSNETEALWKKVFEIRRSIETSGDSSLNLAFFSLLSILDQGYVFDGYRVFDRHLISTFLYNGRTPNDLDDFCRAAGFAWPSTVVHLRCDEAVRRRRCEPRMNEGSFRIPRSRITSKDYSMFLSKLDIERFEIDTTNLNESQTLGQLMEILYRD